jgi:Recombination endonuclease VII
MWASCRRASRIVAGRHARHTRVSLPVLRLHRDPITSRYRPKPVVYLTWKDDAERIAHDAKTACEICGHVGLGLCADYCHDCGAYRGKLCQHCEHFRAQIQMWPYLVAPGPLLAAYLARHRCAPRTAVEASA